jgi:uncharacterized repeat protein (TIGR03803 family)
MGTSGGGASDWGTVFRLDLSGQLTTLHSFDGSDGASPEHGLVEIAGLLYGTASGFNFPSSGAAFRIDLSGANFSVLRVFDSSEGRPLGLTLGSDGLLYGGTSTSDFLPGGIVYRMDTSGALTVLHAFGGGRRLSRATRQVSGVFTERRARGDFGTEQSSCRRDGELRLALLFR